MHVILFIALIDLKLVEPRKQSGLSLMIDYSIFLPRIKNCEILQPKEGEMQGPGSSRKRNYEV